MKFFLLFNLKLLIVHNKLKINCYKKCSNSISLINHTEHQDHAIHIGLNKFVTCNDMPENYIFQCGGQGPGGKAAWQGCNRPSPLPLSPTSPEYRDGYNKTKQCEAHRRWMKRNRIRDASYCYGSSDDEEDDSSNALRQRGEVSAAVNTVLYVGLGTTALGLVISFVGTGEKGFLSPQLRLVGPSLLCAGLLCCLFRVLLCLCLCRCGQCRWQFCHVASHKKEKARKADTRPGTLSTASLLPPTQQERPIAPTSRSVSPATKGHELLLSPAQLPE